VRFIVLAPGAAMPGPGLRVVYDAPDARIFENPMAAPRAFVAPRARCVDDRTALRLLRDRALDTSAEVLLADCATPSPATGQPAREVAARIAVDAPARVVVNATTDAPAWLVLTDTWFPGWRARVDGVETPVLRADHAFRAVALPPGRHDVEFTFMPRGLVIGAVITLVAGAVIVALLLWRRRALVLAGCVAALLAVAGGPVDAALPESPFALSVTPADVPLGGTVRLTVSPRGGVGAWDLYVVWLYAERAAFLDGDGAWRPRPVPFRAHVGAGQTVTGQWTHAAPAGPATLALLAVEPGADPLERLDWRFKPSLATLHVGAGARSGGDMPGATLAMVALAGLVAIAGVLLWPPAGRPGASSTPTSLV
jgi:hypothetical protein